jgi:hypothetical protein
MAIDEEEEKRTCKICCGAISNTLLLPCKHVMCGKCVQVIMLNM